MNMPKNAVQVPPGALLQYYSDLSSGAIAPEDMRIEDLQFKVTINPLGQTTFESQAVTLISRYNFAFRRLVGFAMDADLLGPAAALVSFNVKEQGRDFSVFKRPVSMAALISGGGILFHEWDGVYITVPGNGHRGRVDDRHAELARVGWRDQDVRRAAARRLRCVPR